MQSMRVQNCQYKLLPTSLESRFIDLIGNNFSIHYAYVIISLTSLNLYYKEVLAWNKHELLQT